MEAPTGGDDDHKIMKAEAEKSLEDWFKKYNEKIAKIKEENRKAKSVSDDEPFNWDQVVQMCDLDNMNSIKNKSRMRDILLKLKDCQK